VNGASGRAVMSWFSEGERGLAMSIRQTAVPLGGGIGALTLPFVAAHAGFAALYGLLAALCALGALSAWAWVHEPPVAHAAGRASIANTRQDDGPLRDLRVWRIVAGIGVLCAPQFAVLSFGTVFLHDVGHAGLAAITATMVAVQVCAMVMRIWSGHWTDRRRNRPAYLRACSALSILLFAGLGTAALAASSMAAPSAALQLALLLLIALAGACVSAWHGVAYTELATLSGPARAGTALGMANTSVFGVCFLTPLCIPHLMAWQGWPLVWFAGAACAAIALPLLAPASNAQRTQAKVANASLRRSM
jgi:MFS family permease